MSNQTGSEFNQILAIAKDIFLKKHKDYGTSWRVMRLPSITDQIFIKAKRVRSIQASGVQKIEDDLNSEFIGIINYSIIALMQIHLGDSDEMEIPDGRLSVLYDEAVEKNRALLMDKNHDYDEAWRDMRVSSMTDMVLMKLFRIKQIENNEGKTIISEGVESIYRDMINYAVFCLIKSDFLNNENS